MTAEINPPDVAPASIPVTNKKGPRCCENCQTQLLGDTCYRCGQPTKGLVRQFSSIMGDFFDTVLNIDTRVFRTIGPLIYKPGFLTYEYFSGRRVRYVSPVRLFFFLAVLTFLFAQSSLPENINAKNADGTEPMVQVNVNDDTQGRMSKAKTVAEVEKIRAEALTELNKAEKEIDGVPIMGMAMEQSKGLVNRQADRRIAELKQQDLTTKTGNGPFIAITDDSPALSGNSKNNSEALEEEDDDNIYFNDKPWHAEKNPVKVDWLSTSINNWLNSLVERANNNGKKINKEPAVIVKAVLSALPMTLFFMLPVFALLLKIMYIGKKRLYMEHLIVALHSHAFLMLGMMIMIFLGDIMGWISADSWLQGPLTFLMVCFGFWMPLYLLIMQKRVYQQNWFVTLIKYFIIGNLHFLLLAHAFAVTVVIKLIWL